MTATDLPKRGTVLPWRDWRYAVPALLALLYVFALVRTAWLCDDAFITLRSIYHLLHGYGPTWNVAERVQINVHPLWMLLLSAGIGLTSEWYFTVLAICGVCSAAAVVVATRTVGIRGAVALLLVLVASRAFIDYSTGGLENPLSFLLVAWFVSASLAEGTARIQRLSMIAGLVALTRPDLLLILMPSLFVAARTTSVRLALKALLIGFLPFAAWLAWATFYYGSPIPVIAYAKALSTGLPQSDLLVQGLRYFWDSLLRDPVTLTVITAGVVAGFSRAGTRALALGLVLYLAYILKIGGGFMSGRFFAVSLLVSAVLVARWADRRWQSIVTWIAVGVLAALSPRAPLLSSSDYAVEGDEPFRIGDERAHYYGTLGLLSPTRSPPSPASLTVDSRYIIVLDNAGMRPFLAGPQSHILDRLLCDPLLARLPTTSRDGSKPGHLMRRIPEGYLETLYTGVNQIRHEGLARWYDRLHKVLREPLFSGSRFRALWGLLLGFDSDGLEDFIRKDYWNPPLHHVRYLDIPRKAAAGPPDPAKGQVFVYTGGIELAFDEVKHIAAFTAALDALDIYRFDFRLAGRSLGTSDVKTALVFLGGIADYELRVPPAAIEAGYDSIRVTHVLSIDAQAIVAALAPAGD